MIAAASEGALDSRSCRIFASNSPQSAPAALWIHGVLAAL